MSLTVAALCAELTDRCALVLGDVGLFLDVVVPATATSAQSATTQVFLQGLRRGLKAVGMITFDPLVVMDGDVVNLSRFALERVLDEAERVALARVLMNWHQAMKSDDVPAQAPAPGGGGWREQEQRQVRARLAELDEACRVPYLEPGPLIEVNVPQIYDPPACFGLYPRLWR